jgi:hypothetical protein
MRILATSPVTSTFVETDDGDYMRYGPDNWDKRYGDSWEPYYRCEELEKAYQEYRLARI